MDDILCGDAREHELDEIQAGLGRCLECGLEIEITDPLGTADQRRVA